MSVPKSVTKIRKKNGNISIEFIDSCDRVQYYYHELCRAALRDCCNLLKKRFGEKFYQNFGKVSGRAGKATKYQVISNARTTAPRANIGLKAAKDGGWAYFQEVGTSTQKRLGLLSQTVNESITDIYAIQAQYLSAMSGDSPSVDESEYNG